MIEKNAIKFLKEEFIGINAIDLKRFTHISNEQLKTAIIRCKSKNIFNIIEYLAINESDKEKQSILLGFNNWKHRKQMIEECKQKLERLNGK